MYVWTPRGMWIKINSMKGGHFCIEFVDSKIVQKHCRWKVKMEEYVKASHVKSNRIENKIDENELMTWGHFCMEFLDEKQPHNNIVTKKEKREEDMKASHIKSNEK